MIDIEIENIREIIWLGYQLGLYQTILLEWSVFYGVLVCIDQNFFKISLRMVIMP